MQNTASRILQHVLKRCKSGGLFVSAVKENGRRRRKLGLVVRFNHCKNMETLQKTSGYSTHQDYSVCDIILFAVSRDESTQVTSSHTVKVKKTPLCVENLANLG